MATPAVEKLYTSLLSSTSSSSTNLTELVQQSLSDVSTKIQSNAENRRMQWEYLIRRDLFSHAASAAHDGGYYSKLESWLDLALVFTELSFTDTSYTFTLLSELLETQTIPSCAKIFDWVESRKERLIVGMVPQKGKALVCLRMLNDLLRRLSKAGRETVLFSGRILTFLSQVFPLGERSGVNLRGDYGPVWDAPVDETQKEDSFYQTFWSLQLPFSKPPVFAFPQLTPPQGWTFAQFQEAVDKVLPVIKEATAKERAMMGAGNRITANLRSKHEHDEKDDSEGNEMDYFFAKFLTSPELLDLEIADTHFRRQFLLQLLILLTHLLQFTKAAKPGWMSSKNRSLHMPADWCLDDALVVPAEKNANAVASTSAAAGTDKSSNSKPATSTTTTATATTATANKDGTKKLEPTSTASTQPTSSTPAPPTTTTTTTTTSTSETDPVRWTNLTISRTIEELRQTQPPPSSSSSSSNSLLNGPNGLSGRSFAETVQVMMEREKGWVKWKNELCDPGVFEKGAWEAEGEVEAEDGVETEGDGDGEASTKKKRKLGMYEATRSVRARIADAAVEKKDWRWNLGTEAVTEVWEMGYRGLEDLERGFSPGTPQDFLRQLALEDRKIEMRTKTLRAQQERRLKMQAEAAAAAAKEKKERDAKDAEGKPKSDTTSTKAKVEEQNQDQDVEMKPASPPTSTTAAPIPEDSNMKIETPSSPPGLSLSPIPASSATLAHPSLPPKPAGSSRSGTPVKIEMVPSTGGTTASASMVSEPAPSTLVPPTPTPAPVSAPVLPPLPRDEQITRAEETKHRISWLALRSARDSSNGHLVHFGKIGTGDIKALVDEIHKSELAQAQAEAEAEKAVNNDEGTGMAVDNDNDNDEGESESKVDGEAEVAEEDKMIGVEEKKGLSTSKDDSKSKSATDAGGAGENDVKMV